MEQNQGMPERPTNPVVAALEQTEPVQPTPAPAQAAPAPKKKSSTMALVIVLFLLVAAGGVGFGVWAMMDGNSRVETAKKNCSSSTEVITKCDVDGDPKDETETIVEYNPDYIYVSAWGIRIKKPDTWKTTIETITFDNAIQAAKTLVITEYSELANASLSIDYATSEQIFGEGCGHWAYAPDVCFELRGDGDSLSIHFGDGISDELRSFFSNKDNYSAF